MESSKDIAKDYHIPDLGIDLIDPQSALRKHLGNEVIITNFKGERLLKKEDYNLTNVLELDLTIKRNQNAPEEHLNLVAKLFKPYIEKEIIFMTRLFQNEIYVYEELLPMYGKLLRNSRLKEKELINLTPKIYGSRLPKDPDDTNVLVIVENLKPKGYQVLDVTLGVGLIEARLVVTEIAKFHALGIVCKHRDPEFFETTQALIQKSFYRDSGTSQYNFCKNPENDLLTISRLRPYEDRIRRAMPLGQWWGIKYSSDEPWSTIIHGDLWTTNILFHYDVNNQVDDVKFIDFQTAACESCCKDLLYFLLANCSPDVVTNNFDELVDDYYQSFVKMLKKVGLNEEKYNRASFNEELDSIGKQALFRVIRFLRIASNKNCINMSMEELVECAKNSISHSGYEERVYPVVKKLLDKNWI